MTDNGFSAVIFDLDGTLIEVDNLRWVGDELLKRTLRQFGVKRTSSKDRIGFWFSGGGFLLLLRKWGIKDAADRRSFLDILSSNEYDLKKELMGTGKVRLYDDADILGKLWGKLKLGLVSNSSLKAVSLELQYFELSKYFDSVVALGDFRNNLRPKPEPDGILRCLNELHEDPSKSIVVGDNETDIIAGEKSGALTALITRGKRARMKDKMKQKSANTTFQLSSLTELEELVL
ncbi:MAG: HAD family hydrolase [Candidatus Atabeyarchaeum deiterrae]